MHDDEMDHGDARRARRRLVARILGGLLLAALTVADVAWKLLVGWPAADRDAHPPNWMYLPPRVVLTVVLVWWAWGHGPRCGRPADSRCPQTSVWRSSQWTSQHRITRQERIVHGVLACTVLAGHVGWVVQP